MATVGVSFWPFLIDRDVARSSSRRLCFWHRAVYEIDKRAAVKNGENKEPPPQECDDGPYLNQLLGAVRAATR